MSIMADVWGRQMVLVKGNNSLNKGIYVGKRGKEQIEGNRCRQIGTDVSNNNGCG